MSRQPDALPGPTRDDQPSAGVPATGWRESDDPCLSLNVAPSVARVYDYLLGGKDNFGVDREVGDAVARLLPWIVPTVRANRRFLVRAVRYLAGDCGVRQFVDLGSGLPTSPNVHEVAQAQRGDARTVYVDRDPVVLAHARALLMGDGQTTVVAGDAREPEKLLHDIELTGLVDRRQPVAVLMVAVLHFLADHDRPAETVAAFRQAMAPGSFLVISHATPGPPDLAGEAREAMDLYRKVADSFTPRSRDDVLGLFDGFDVIAPGLVPVDQWRPPGHRLSQRASRTREQGAAGIGRLVTSAGGAR